jgi:hypothetical protein
VAPERGSREAAASKDAQFKSCTGNNAGNPAPGIIEVRAIAQMQEAAENELASDPRTRKLEHYPIRKGV